MLHSTSIHQTITNALAATIRETQRADALQAENAELRATIQTLRWNPVLKMYRAAGLDEAIRTLPTDATYTVVLCDIDRLKTINAVTGNHMQTDRYLRAGLKVRAGEIAGQLHDQGDEIAFILHDHSQGKTTNPAAFVARIARQLAGQPLTIGERCALAAAQHVPIDAARLSATFATLNGVAADGVPAAIEALSCQVLALKAQRDGRC